MVDEQVTQIVREGTNRMRDPPGTHVDIVDCEGPSSIKPAYKAELGRQTRMKQYFIADREHPEYEDPEWVDHGIFVTEVTSIDPESGVITLVRRQSEPGAFIRPRESAAFTVSDCTIVREPNGCVVSVSTLHVETQHGYSADIDTVTGGFAAGWLCFPDVEIRPGDSWQAPNSAQDTKNPSTCTFLGYANVDGRVCMKVNETSRTNWSIPVHGPTGVDYDMAAHLLCEATYYLDHELGRVHRKEMVVRTTVDSDISGFGSDERVYRSVSFVADATP